MIAMIDRIEIDAKPVYDNARRGVVKRVYMLGPAHAVVYCQEMPPRELVERFSPAATMSFYTDTFRSDPYSVEMPLYLTEEEARDLLAIIERIERRVLSALEAPNAHD